VPAIRTDDATRRLRAVWLGPKGKTLAFEWTYVQWSLCILLVGIGALIGFALLAPFDRTFALLAGPMWGGVLGFFATRWVVSQTNFDQPLRWWRRTLRGEWARSARIPRTREERVNVPPVIELGSEAAHALWRHRGEDGPSSLNERGHRYESSRQAR